jgi:predicted dehydrogenase
MRRVRWGVLGVANIAMKKVIPAMQRGTFCEVVGIASRDEARARRAAGGLGLSRAYGSYEALLDDETIDAVYNPLPNHLHVPWTIRAAERGKHVLCEKPIALSAEEGRQLLAVRDRTGVKIQEAFMVRAHPQWQMARALVREGRLGVVRAMVGAFSYFNTDPANIRNVPQYGGGALMDIGCYLINTSRFIFEREPQRVFGAIERDPDMGTDRLTSMLLDFGGAHLVGTCSTQMVPFQQIHILGSRGRLEIEIPFNAPPDRPCTLVLDTGADLAGRGRERIELAVCDQYMLQGDLFSKAILDDAPVPEPLEDSIRNMECLEAIVAADALRDARSVSGGGVHRMK